MNKTEIIAATFYGVNTVSAYACLLKIKIGENQVVINAHGDDEFSNVVFNYKDADHTAAENFDMTAHEVFELLESEHDIENNYGFLEEFADVKIYA